MSLGVVMEKKQLYRRFDSSMVKKYTVDAIKDKPADTPNSMPESLLNKTECSSTQNEAVMVPSRTLCNSTGNQMSFTDSIENSDNGFKKVKKGRLEMTNGLRISTYAKTRDVGSPLKDMLCTGQKVEFQGEKAVFQNDKDATSNPASKYSVGRHQEAHSVALNKLYSSLKRLKCRHDTILQEDVHMRCSSFPFNSSKSFGQNWLQSPTGEEDIFILLGGKSKPVRFEVNPENINLLESEFGINLKSKAANSILDREDLELLRRFRDKYRSGHGSSSPILPWARHAVCRGRKPVKESQTSTVDLPSATYDIEEEEFGRKLSIHVYLPNVVPGDTPTNTL